MYYGWFIVAATFVGMGFQAGFYAYAFSLFVLPWQEAFEADRASVMLTMTGSTLVGLFTAPLVGKLVDRVPAKIMLAAGALLHGAGFYLMSLSTSLWQLVVAFGLFLSLGSQLLGNIATGAIVSRWFTALRGRALGISTIGTSIGGMVLPLLVADWIAASGWRIALQYLAMAHMVIVLPLMLLLIRQPPADQTPAAGDPAAADWTLATLIKNRNFWFLVPAIGMLITAYSSILANLSPYGISIGLSDAEAARLITLVALCGIVGKVVFGVLSDKISLKVGLWSAQGLVALALLLMAGTASLEAATIASMVLGLAAGGLLPVWAAMVASLFGAASFGRVMGLMTPFTILLVMPGYTIAGALYDLSGNYTLCFIIFAGLLGLGALAAVPLRFPEQTTAARQ